jgi:hypothetical protein
MENMGSLIYISFFFLARAEDWGSGTTLVGYNEFKIATFNIENYIFTNYIRFDYVQIFGILYVSR